VADERGRRGEQPGIPWPPAAAGLARLPRRRGRGPHLRGPLGGDRLADHRVMHDVLRERWRHAPTWANGQLAVGCYLFDQGRGCFTPAVIDVLTLDGDRIAAVTAFIFHDGARDITPAGAFARFGLPAELP
jgi:hypothetical protein